MKRHSFYLLALVALMLSACLRKPYFPKQQRGNEYYRTFQWQYQGHAFKVELVLPVSVVDHYDSLPKDRAYLDCIREDVRYPYALHLAEVLDSIAEPYGFTETEMDEYYLSFVQSIGYKLDPGGHGYNRSPALTLFEGGDCVDLVCLYSVLGAVRGKRTCLLLFPEHHHMAAGIEVDGNPHGGYRSSTDHLYAFAECTSKGWALGVNSCNDDSAIITEIMPVVTEWSKAHAHEDLQCRMLDEVVVTRKKPRPDRRRSRHAQMRSVRIEKHGQPYSKTLQYPAP